MVSQKILILISPTRQIDHLRKKFKIIRQN